MRAAFQFVSCGTYRRKFPRVATVLEFSHDLLRGDDSGWVRAEDTRWIPLSLK